MLSAPADRLVHIICFSASKLEYSTATHYKCNQIYCLIFLGGVSSLLLKIDDFSG